ncbi:MAG: PIG-L family deacetylase, partial [Gemmatimonadaceae bacterium]
MKRVLFTVVAAMSVLVPCRLVAQTRGTAQPEKLRVLWIAAHPDDEDTQLLTWLSRSGRADAAYLSLTRGDGGQNLIGNELGEQLGIIRTEELLAARRVDGAHQYFTRAYDFGFSKTAA